MTTAPAAPLADRGAQLDGQTLFTAPARVGSDPQATVEAAFAQARLERHTAEGGFAATGSTADRPTGADAPVRTSDSGAAATLAASNVPGAVSPQGDLRTPPTPVANADAALTAGDAIAPAGVPAGSPGLTSASTGAPQHSPSAPTTAATPMTPAPNVAGELSGSSVVTPPVVTPTPSVSADPPAGAASPAAATERVDRAEPAQRADASAAAPFVLPAAPQASAVAPQVATPVSAGGSVPAPLPHHQIVQAMTPVLRRPDGTYQVEIDLTPEHLGSVKVHLEMRAGEIVVSMQAADTAGRDSLRDSMDDLRRMLEAQGGRHADVSLTDGGASAGFAGYPGQPGGTGAFTGDATSSGRSSYYAGGAVDETGSAVGDTTEGSADLGASGSSDAALDLRV